MELLKSSKILSVLLVSLSFPLVVLAEPTIKGIFGAGTNIIVLSIQALSVLAVAVFLWGIVRFLVSADSPEKRNSSKNLIIYGLIGLFVLVTFWGIIKIIAYTFNVSLMQ
ncbi:MAG: hypothetical protein ABII97_00260 [Patescibacteria group bacterium]